MHRQGPVMHIFIKENDEIFLALATIHLFPLLAAISKQWRQAYHNKLSTLHAYLPHLSTMSPGHSHSEHSNIIVTLGKVDIVVLINSSLTTQSWIERRLYQSVNSSSCVSVEQCTLCVVQTGQKSKCVRKCTNCSLKAQQKCMHALFLK